MRSSWNQVVAEIERSGLVEQKQLMLLNHKRQSQVQQEILDQITIAINKRGQENKQKKNERMAVEADYRNYYQKEKKNKEQYKQKQQKMRMENFRMLNQADHRNSSGFNPPVYKQNPITETLLSRSDLRAQKQRDFKKQFDQINLGLVEGRLKSQIEIKKLKEQQDQEYKKQIEEKFRKIEESRLKFQKECLEGKHKAEQKLLTEPDSLQKQYSLYLDKQIAEKKTRQDYSIFRAPATKDDQIKDPNILKINHNPQVQSSSPAYLGRIPYNHDRQRQLQYLNRQLSRHQRTKTQSSTFREPQYKKPQPQIQQTKSQPKLVPTVLPTPEIKSPHKKIAKDFKFYNIITGNMMVRTEELNG